MIYAHVEINPSCDLVLQGDVPTMTALVQAHLGELCEVALDEVEVRGEFLWGHDQTSYDANIFVSLDGTQDEPYPTIATKLNAALDAEFDSPFPYLQYRLTVQEQPNVSIVNRPLPRTSLAQHA
jgi:hypothetical protein